MSKINKRFLLSITTIFELAILLLFYLILPKLTILCLLTFALYIILQEKILTTPSKKITSKSMKCAEFVPNFSKFPVIYTETKIPRIGSKQVLIEVHSASINPIDCKLNFALFPFKRWTVSLTVGYDVCGKIIELGNKVTEFKVGDTIFGFSKSGSFAEYTVSDVDQIWKVTNEQQKEELGSSCITGATIYQSLTWFFKEEEFKEKNILIIGASGGCGSIACIFAKAFKSGKVVGICSTKNLNYVSTITDVAIGYDSSDLDAKLNKEGKFDLILDTVTSEADGDMHKKYIQFLVDGGKYVQINGDNSTLIKGALASKYSCFKGLEPKNFHLHLMNFDSCQISFKRLDEIFRDNSSAHVKLEKLGLNYEDLKTGFDKINSRRAVGKIIFEIKQKNL